MSRNNIFRASYLAAPIFLFFYGIAHFVDGLDGSYGPGFAWTVGHIMFLLALLTFGVIMIALRQRLVDESATHKFIATLALIVGLIGIITFARIAVIDIITGLRAPDNVAMGAISSQLNAYPFPSLAPFYNIGPLLFQLGLLVLMIQLAMLQPRQLPWWSPILLLGGFLLLGFNLNLLMLGAIIIGIALVPLVSIKDGISYQTR